MLRSKSQLIELVMTLNSCKWLRPIEPRRWAARTVLGQQQGVLHGPCQRCRALKDVSLPEGNDWDHFLGRNYPPF